MQCQTQVRTRGPPRHEPQRRQRAPAHGRRLRQPLPLAGTGPIYTKRERQASWVVVNRSTDDRRALNQEPSPYREARSSASSCPRRTRPLELKMSRFTSSNRRAPPPSDPRRRRLLAGPPPPPFPSSPPPSSSVAPSPRSLRSSSCCSCDDEGRFSSSSSSLPGRGRRRRVVPPKPRLAASDEAAALAAAALIRSVGG